MNTRTGRFTRHHRINQPADFNQAFKSGRRSRDSNFTVLAHRNDQPVARLGMAVSVRSAGTVVKRNMIKRQVREYFRRYSHTLQGWDIVVVSGRSLRNTDRTQLRRSLEYHWQQLSVCTSSSTK